MKTKTMTKTVSFKEEALAKLKSKNPHFKPDENTLGLLQGLDDVINGRIEVWKPRTK